MNKRLITNYLLNEEKRNVGKIIERELKLVFVKEKAISIIGPRKAGKTYFLYKLREKFQNFLHINFENIVFKGITASDVYEIIGLYQEIFGKKPKNLFLDEIQRLDDWQSLVRSLLESSQYNVFISGSSSKLLSKEIATQLRGRTLTYLLLPFSFREFLKAKNIEKKKYFTIEEEARIKRELRTYMGFGAFPEVVLKKERKRILREYFNTILYTDYVERFQLKNIELARVLFEFSFQNFSKEISIRKLVNFLGGKLVKSVGKNTIYEYIGKMPETLIVYFVEKFSKGIYERASWPRKLYVCDLGITKILGFGEDIGKKMENIVFLELMRGVNVEPLRTIYFYKSKEGEEVDFVVKEGVKIRYLIQVTYASVREDIEGHEIKLLLKASEELRCKNLLIITWDYEGEEEHKGKKIKFIPLWKWLLLWNRGNPSTTA